MASQLRRRHLDPLVISAKDVITAYESRIVGLARAEAFDVRAVWRCVEKL